jgi:hypothetical protein
MSGQIPSLVIPVRMDAGSVKTALAALGQAGQKAGDDTAKGMKKAKESTAELGGELGGLMRSQVSLSALKQVAGAMNDVMREASDYTKRVAQGFINIQKAMQGISALTGKPNTNAFTLSEVQAGAAANLKPDQWTQFRDAFLSKASNYVGAGPNAKLSGAEGDKFQASMAEYAAQHGVSAGEMADFAGGLLAQQKTPTTAADMTSKAGRVFATLEASSAKVGHLLPGMTRVMAQGISAEDSASTLAMMPELAPEEESTHLLRVFNELRQAKLEGKSGAFGVTPQMGMQEQLEAVVGNLKERSDKGEDLEALLSGITKESIAQNTLRGLVGQGPKGFAQWKGILQATPDNAVETSIAAGRQTDAGQQMRVEAQLALAEAERGAVNTGKERLKMEAEAQLTHEKRFDTLHPEDYLRMAAAGIKGTSTRNQLINERAVDIGFERAQVPENQRTPLVMGAHQQVADETIRKLLERQNQLMEADAGRQKAPVLSAPPRPADGARNNN